MKYDPGTIYIPKKYNVSGSYLKYKLYIIPTYIFVFKNILKINYTYYKCLPNMILIIILLYITL